jgi:hypothetical protein
MYRPIGNQCYVASILIGHRYAHHYGGPTMHYSRICCRFSVGSADTLANTDLRGHNALTGAYKRSDLLLPKLPSATEDVKVNNVT